jgi:hypothetical protein
MFWPVHVYRCLTLKGSFAMSHFFEMAARVQLRGKAEEYIDEGFFAEHPLLARAMGGSPATESEPAFLPHSLILFWEGGRLKFCLSRKGLPNCCFGTVEDPSKGLQGVEKAIADGHFEWKPRRVH